MSRIVLGFAPFVGHSLTEIPDETLGELSQRFPLQADKCESRDRTDLLITIAVHEELSRRKSGGARRKSVPTPKEMAIKLVTAGYHHLSKQYHPDRDGAPAAQQTLNQLRDRLLGCCEEIPDYGEDTIVISPQADDFQAISDADIPF